MPQLRQTVLAHRDLLDIWVHIATDNPTAADHVHDRLQARVRILEQFPEAGPARPDIADTARALLEPPYRILPDAVQVMRVLHGARRIDTALFSEGLE